MSRARAFKFTLTAIVALCSLIAAAPAGAAAWQPPLQISSQTPSVGDTSDRIALGTSGDAGAGWWDNTAGGRIVLDRKRAGSGWSGPVPVVATATFVPVFTGVDGSGDVTAAFNTGTTVPNIAQWPAGAASPSATTLTVPGGALTINDLAVNASGDAVLAGIDASATAQTYVAYRHGFNGTFAVHPFTSASVANGAATSARVAINAAGAAVVVFRAGPSALWGSMRTASVDWSTPVQVAPTTPLLNVGDPPTVAIDGAGRAVTAFVVTDTTIAGTPNVVRAAISVPGGWQVSGNISDQVTAGIAPTTPAIVVNPSGTALLIWAQTGPVAANNQIQASFGSTGTGLWSGFETVNQAGAAVPVAAIGNDGMAVVAWEQDIGSGQFLGEAKVRSPGAGGTWGDLHFITANHTNPTQPWISTDGLGDFATISAPVDSGAVNHAVVSVYDAAPPAVSPIAVTGTLLAGEPVGLAVTATDSWSSVGVPTWTFGDGGTGSGGSVQHVYAAPGTYTVHVTVGDGSANSAGKDIAVTIASPQAALTSATFAGKWKVSRVKGTLTVVGTAPRAGSYDVDVLKGKARKIHVTYTLQVGAFTKTIKLPAKFLPGTYTVSLIPADAQVKGASRTASLAAPVSGVVDVAFLSGARNGTAARTLTGASTIWASFHFAAKPKGKLTLTWFRIGKKRVRLGATSKDSAVKVVSYLRNTKPFVGTYQAVLSRKGVIIARATVKAKKG